MLSIYINQKDNSCLLEARMDYPSCVISFFNDFPKNKFTSSNFSTSSSSGGKVIKYSALTALYGVVIIIPIIR